MKYIYFFIFLFSFSGYVYSKPIAGYNTPKLTPLPPLVDKNNPVVKFCETNGGTFIPEKLDKCLLPNNIKFYAWAYWENGIDKWTEEDFQFYKDNYYKHYLETYGKIYERDKIDY